jgi:hypothetical protein
MTDKLFTTHHHGMPGVVSTLKSNDHIGVFGQQVNNFAFAFVPPLGSDDYDICHFSLLFDSPPASLESQRSQRVFSFNFQLSPAKEQQDLNKSRKLKIHVLRAIVFFAILTPSRINKFSRLRRGIFYVCRPYCPPV